MESRKNHLLGLLFAFGAGLFWSLGGWLIKSVQWHPMAIAGGRSLIAFFMIWAIIGRPKITGSKAQIGGALAYACTVILFVAANKLTTAANAILLQYTGPVYTAFFGAKLLGERVGRADWSAVFLVLGGVLLFFLDRLTIGGMTGNILALISGLSFGLLAVFLRQQKDASGLESVLLGNLIAALVGLPFLFSGLPDSRSLMYLLLLGVFQLGLSYILYTEALKRIKALESILIASIEPVLNPLWVFLTLGERPGPWALVGGAVVLITVIGRSLYKTFRTATEEMARRPFPEE